MQKFSPFDHAKLPWQQQQGMSTQPGGFVAIYFVAMGCLCRDSITARLSCIAVRLPPTLALHAEDGSQNSDAGASQACMPPPVDLLLCGTHRRWLHHCIDASVPAAIDSGKRSAQHLAPFVRFALFFRRVRQVCIRLPLFRLTLQIAKHAGCQRAEARKVTSTGSPGLSSA